MSTDVAVKFADNWNVIQGVSALKPSTEKIELAGVGQQVEAEPEKPQLPKADMGSVHLASDNLRNDYKGGFAPRGDISFACNELGKNISELFGSFGLSSNEPQEMTPQVAAMQPQHNYGPKAPSIF